MLVRNAAQNTDGIASVFSDDRAAQKSYAARRQRLRWRKRVLPVAAVLALVLIWWVLVEFLAVPPYIAPSPMAVGKALAVNVDVLVKSLAFTATEALLGFVVGNVAAIIIAACFVYSRSAEEAFFPVAVMINTIPVIAKAPILVLLLGTGMAPKIAIAALICFFPTLVNMTRGFRDVNPQALELMKIISASERDVFWKLRVPNALPPLFSALKVAASTAVIGAIVGEWIGSNDGIGALILRATYNFDSALLYATVFTASTFSVGFFWLIAWIERQALKWNPNSNA